MVDTAAANLTQTIEELQAEIRNLARRLASLESAEEAHSEPPAKSVPAPAPALVTSPVPAGQPEEAIGEETLLVLSAAIAAFLGERAHIRQVRLLRYPGWARQGRVSIQASHYLHNS